MRVISKFILKMLGWTLVGAPPKGVNKAVFITAPHTSLEDFFVGRLYCWARGIPSKIFIKKEAFKWYYFGLLQKVGGIPIDRSKPGNKVENIAEMIKTTNPIFLAITPEGTRKRVENWKRGFYYIALKAEVPVVLSYLDYAKKEVGIGPIMKVTGDFVADFKQIEDFYRGMTGKHPEMFNLWEKK